jgi:hypothetical protein
MTCMTCHREGHFASCEKLNEHAAPRFNFSKKIFGQEGPALALKKDIQVIIRWK